MHSKTEGGQDARTDIANYSQLAHLHRFRVVLFWLRYRRQWLRFYVRSMAVIASDYLDAAIGTQSRVNWSYHAFYSEGTA